MRYRYPEEMHAENAEQAAYHAQARHDAIVNNPRNVFDADPVPWRFDQEHDPGNPFSLEAPRHDFSAVSDPEVWITDHAPGETLTLDEFLAATRPPPEPPDLKEMNTRMRRWLDEAARYERLATGACTHPAMMVAWNMEAARCRREATKILGRMEGRQPSNTYWKNNASFADPIVPRRPGSRRLCPLPTGMNLRDIPEYVISAAAAEAGPVTALDRFLCDWVVKQAAQAGGMMFVKDGQLRYTSATTGQTTVIAAADPEPERRGWWSRLNAWLNAWFPAPRFLQL